MMLRRLMAIVLAILVLSGAGMIRDGLEKSAARKEYERMALLIREEENPAGQEKAAGDGTSAGRNAGAEGAGKSLYEQLEEINPDFVCVLRIPVLDLAYPVAASRDNEEYLSRTFEGESSPDGCIFLDCGSDRDLESAHAFIFGHNMQSGTMFGRLKELPEKQTLAEAPFFFLDQEGRKRQYRIFAYGPVDAGNEAVYRYAGTGEDKLQWLSAVQQSAAWFDPDGAAAAAGAPVVTLSTCWGSSAERVFMVHGVLVEDS